MVYSFGWKPNTALILYLNRPRILLFGSGPGWVRPLALEKSSQSLIFCIRKFTVIQEPRDSVILPGALFFGYDFSGDGLIALNMEWTLVRLELERG